MSIENIPPTTTAAEDVTTASQRRVNLIWETVQASIALSVVWVTLLACYKLLPDSLSDAGSNAFLLLGNLASLIIGFYFGRTNHQRIGGVQSGQSGR